MSRPFPDTGHGILSIWNDYPADDLDQYERWYMTEHFPERLGVPGFLRGRRYRAIEADRTYFTFYELTTPGVLFSEAYLERLDDPTAWTTHAMQNWGSMFRTVCHRTARAGHAVGGFAAVARFDGPVNISRGQAAHIREQLADPRVVAVDLWHAASEQNAPTREASQRREADLNITAAILIETTCEKSARDARERLPDLLQGNTTPPTTGIYQLMAIEDAPAG
ncbi:MAG: hypothetical protein ACK5JT_22740 [Hyphomicrobiaceae bacterium]